MNAILDETQARYCDIIDKSIKVNNKSKQPNSKTYTHKKQHCIVVKKYETIKPENDETDYILKDVG